MQRLEHLNGLRGVAALVVVVHHFFYSFLMYAAKGSGPFLYEWQRWMYHTPLQLLIAGNFAVCIFFILSGFVLSYGYFRGGGQEFVRRSAAKRYFRLMPPILASVLISWFILQTGWHWNSEAAGLSGAPWLANFWPRTVSFAEAVWYGAYGIIIGNAEAGLLSNPLWTMKVEFLGSLLVFVTLVLAGGLRRRWIVYLALGLVTLKTYYLGFVIGMALCDLYCTRPTWRPRSWILALAALGGFVLGAAPIPGPEPSWYYQALGGGISPEQWFIWLHELGALLVMVAVLWSVGAARLLASRPLAYLGRISFALYLLHVLVLGTLTSYTVVVVNLSQSYGWALGVAFVSYVIVCILAADIFMRWVDEPSIRLATKIGRKLVPKSQPSAI